MTKGSTNHYKNIINPMGGYTKRILSIITFFGASSLLASAIFTVQGNTNFATALTDTSSKTTVIDVNPMIAISVPSSLDLTINPTPTGSDLQVATGTVSVATNNLTGYNLSFSLANTATTTALTNTNDTTQTIPSLTSTTTSSNFPVNQWGYSTDYTSGTGNFDVLPSLGSTIQLKQTQSPSAADNTAFSIGTRIDTTKVSGTYSNTLTFTAITNLPPPEPELTAVSPAYISAQDTSTKTITLTGTDLDYATSIQIGSEYCTNITAISSTSVTCEIGSNQGVLDSTTDFYEAGMSSSNPTMQAMTSAISNKTSSPTPIAISINGQTTSTNINYYQETTLADTRDNKTYTIVKQADNNTWMTQNLDLDLATTTTLTSDNTNLTSTTTWTPERDTIPTGSLSSSTWIDDYNHPYSYDPGDEYYYTSGTTSNDTQYTSLSACTAAGHSESDCKHYHEGNYYNWSAAVASNDTSSHTTAEETMPDSICPKGWRLPQASSSPSEFGTLFYQSGITTSATSSSYTTDGFNNVRTNPLYWVRSGYVYSGSRYDLGSIGYYWSSAVNSSSSARYAGFYSSNIYPRSNNYRYVGFSVRCVAE